MRTMQWTRRKMWLYLIAMFLYLVGALYLDNVADQYPIMSIPDRNLSGDLLIVYFVFALIIPSVVYVGIKHDPAITLLAFIFVCFLPLYYGGLYRYINAKLDATIPDTKHVVLSNTYSGHRNVTCEVTGLASQKSVHLFNCGNEPFAHLVSYKSRAIGQRIKLTIGAGYFHDRWVVAAERLP